MTISIVFGALSGFLGGVFSAVKDSTVYGKAIIYARLLFVFMVSSFHEIQGPDSDASYTISSVRYFF